MSSNTVSVVIPCYNAAPFLRETLDTVLAQTCPPLEVLVVDDGSRDNSAAIAASYGPPIRVIRQENQGESVARNRGIEEARGDWIAFLDSDDLWEPTKLERQLAAITPEVVCLHTNWWHFGIEESFHDSSEIPLEQRYSLAQLFTSVNPFLLSSLLIRRSHPARFPTWTQYGEDLIYCVEVSRNGGVVLIPEPLVRKRVHGRSQSEAPDIFARRHETWLHWLALESHGLDQASVDSLRRAIDAYLVDVAWGAYWRRNWAQFWALRNYLEQFAGEATVDELLRKPIYPAFAYYLKDAWDALRARRTQGSRDAL